MLTHDIYILQGRLGIGLAFAFVVLMTKLRPHLQRFGPKKILIVDDDLDLRETFDLAFRQEDYDVLSAKDGAEAMDILNCLSEEDLPDLIILDYQMPRMDGVTFSHLKAQDLKLAPIPVVLLSASGDKPEVRAKTLADAYIEKPLELNRLLELAHHFIYRVETARFSFLV